MTCEMTHDRLWAWVHGEEEDGARCAEIASHVERCDACRDQVAEMREILGDLNDMGGSPARGSMNKLPESVRGYRIIQTIGRGGMGVVYEAEQEQPRRSVALKVILGGPHVDDLQIRLFQREVQTLARLNHPAIASIYDAGCTEDSQHFFAMEMVRGVELLDHIDGQLEDESVRSVPLPRRLRLFHRICEAINYAHQRGVIHRDIKPSNILIDEEGNPKILDFGLARIVEHDLAMPSIHTEAGKLLGTLPYMSPEQAQGRPEEIDVRTDVYSLGVVFYELMTGVLPYDVGRTSLVHAVRVISEQSPIYPRTANSAIPSDVATIILKALEKEPDRRYQSADALADDVDRYLNGHPILARPPSTVYQLRKLVARHKAPSLLTALLMVSITVSGIVAVFQARRIQEENRKKSRVIEVLDSLYASADMWNAGRRDITVLESLDANVAEIEVELSDDPLVAATVRNTIGKIYLGHSELGPAERHLKFALDARQAALGDHHIETAESLNDFGELRYHQGRFREAERCWRRALATRRALAFDDEAVAESLNNLGNLIRKKGDTQQAEAERYLREALTIRRKILARRQTDPAATSRQRKTARNNVAQSLNNLGGLLRQKGMPDDLDQAKRHYREALRIREATLGSNHPEVGKMHNNLARLLHDQGDFVGAEAAYREALRIWRTEEGLGREHQFIARVLHSLARLLHETGKPAEAEAMCIDALEMRRLLLGEDHRESADSTNLLKTIRAADNAASGDDSAPRE